MANFQWSFAKFNLLFYKFVLTYISHEERDTKEWTLDVVTFGLVLKINRFKRKLNLLHSLKKLAVNFKWWIKTLKTKNIDKLGNKRYENSIDKKEKNGRKISNEHIIQIVISLLPVALAVVEIAIN